MVCKNRRIYGFLGPSRVLISYIICPPVIFGVSPRFLFVGPTPAHFLPRSGFLSTEGFESRSFGPYTSKEYSLLRKSILFFERAFSYWRRLFWKGDPPASNAVRCGVLGAETKTVASSHQQPTTELAECSTFDASIIQRKIVTSKVTNPHNLYVLHPSSNSHLVYFSFQLGLYVALSCIAFSYLGRQNELTFVGAIS